MSGRNISSDFAASPNRKKNRSMTAVTYRRYRAVIALHSEVVKAINRRSPVLNYGLLADEEQKYLLITETVSLFGADERTVSDTQVRKICTEYLDTFFPGHNL